LARRGVTASGAALATALGTHAVSAAPAGLVAAVSTAALAGGASGTAASISFLKIMAISKLKLAGVAVAAGLGTALVVEQQQWSSLRRENAALEQQVAELRQPAGIGPGTPDTAGGTGVTAAPNEDQAQELDRLERDVGALRQEPNDLPRLQAENKDLKAITEEPDDPLEAEFQDDNQVRLEHLKQWGLSFLLYAQAHDDRIPESFEQAASIQGSEAMLEFDTNQFEIVYRGTLQGVADPGNTIFVRELQARQSPNGQWAKVYGFADGHTATHTEQDETAFAAWEKDRIATQP
jgi:hypothetical protein